MQSIMMQRWQSRAQRKASQSVWDFDPKRLFTFASNPKRHSKASPVDPPRARHPRPTETNQAAASSAWPRRTARHPWFRSNPSMSAYFNTDLPLPP